MALPIYRGLFFYHLFAKGIFYPIETHTCFLSAAHSDADVDYIERAYRESVLETQAAGFFAGPEAAPTSAIPRARIDGPPMSVPSPTAVPALAPAVPRTDSPTAAAALSESASRIEYGASAPR